MKKFKFSKLLSMLLAVLITLFTSGFSVQAAKPTAAPTTITGAETNAAGSIITLTFNKSMQEPINKQNLFKININGSVQTPIKASLSTASNTKIDLTLSASVKYGSLVTVSYASSPKTAVKSTDGVALTSFSNYSVINNVIQPVIQSINYVSLGDSIATGTTGTSTTTSFPYQFRDYLQNTYYPNLNAGTNITTNVQLLQHAINGQTTPELIDRLDATSDYVTGVSYDTAMIEDVKAASIITLSIGGNDLMQWATIPGFEPVDWISAKKSADDFVNIYWVKLIDTIKGLNPTAILIVTTGYNPYNLEAVPGYESDVAVTLDGDFSPSSKTESLVTEMRSAVINNVTKGYKIADVYSDFHAYQPKSMGEIIKFYPYLFGLAAPYLRDPHPNQTGQNRISNLIINTFNTLQ